MAVGLGYVRQLHEVAVADKATVGAKAANLGELLKAGFAVPDGFVLTVGAFERFLAFHGFGPSARPEEVAAAALPDDVAEELLSAHAPIGEVAVAVRSSGVAEDLPDASFAGQYETLLGVRGESDVLRAVVRCWSAAFSERVRSYRSSPIDGHAQPMAVLVQRLVEPDAAGVAFTVNPVTGVRDEVVVNAVRGLGERLVSGEAQPDEWHVRGDRAELSAAPENAIRSEHAVLVAETARRIEAHFGSPQDVEWAIAGERLYVLQARPVTALRSNPVAEVQVPVEVPSGFWQREATHFPRPATPMLRGFMDHHNAAFREMCAVYGLLLEGVEMREIGGWMYARAVPLGGKDRKAPPAALMWLMARAAPALRDRIRVCREAIRSDRHGRDIERWYGEWQPELVERLRALAAVDLAGLSDAELDAHVAQIEDDLVPQCLSIHFLLHGAMIMVLSEFAFACRELLGWGDGRVLDALSGLSEKSSEPARRLAELAVMAASSSAVRELLEHGATDPDDVLAADDAFAAAFRAYQREYGCRDLGYEFIEPTLAERPDLLVGLIRDQVLRGYDPGAAAQALVETRAATIGDARAALAGRPRDRARFERVLARAERAYPVREDSEFYTVSAPLGVMRYAVLEVGRRLADRGQIDRSDDVFFLDVPELRAALGSGEQQQAIVSRRRAERAWVIAHPGPASSGRDPGPPPPAHALPGEARFAMEAVQWVLMDRILAPRESARVQPSGDRLSGIAASTGSYTGPARLVMGEADFDKVQAGDVLVCPITSPVWSVLFPSIGALVTDTGGTLSHAAIIAREYRLPAVVGTGNATSLLRNGQIVTVEGDAGAVLVGG